jgi:gliding motility-associated protein GldM
MALPKEPRQKMINMMYLVLTALLALNVSKEVLNAFKVVDGSLKRSNTTLTASTGDIYISFESAVKDEKTRAKAELLKPIADKIKSETANLEKEIEAYRNKILDAASYDPATGEIKKEDNLDIGTRIMDTEGGGDKLFKAIQAYQDNLKTIMGKEYVAVFGNRGTPLSDSSVSSGKVLVEKQFRMQPVVANITMLSKVMNDLKNTESQAVKYLFSQIGAVVVRLNKFEPLVSMSATYLMPGQEMEVQAGMGAFNDDAKPTISINGRNVTVGPNGVGSTKFQVNSSGSVSVKINYIDPNTGESKSLDKTVPYVVGTPGTSSVSADKMKVFYIGVDNPVTIGSSAGWDKTSVSMQGGSISGGNGRFNVRVSSEGKAVVIVNSDGKPTPHEFRVKRLPPAAVFCAGQKQGAMSSAALKAQGGLAAQLENSDFEASYQVVSYKVTVNGKAGYQEAQNTGNRWSGAAASLVNSCVPGSSITFENVKIKGPDGQVRPASNEVLSFYLR